MTVKAIRNDEAGRSADLEEIQAGLETRVHYECSYVNEPSALATKTANSREASSMLIVMIQQVTHKEPSKL
jgi:hypothetical protein